MDTVILEKQTATQLVKKFPTFYATQSFSTMITTAYHCSLSWDRWIYSTISHLISPWLIL